MTWQTSYGLPGEGLPPRVQADITLEWSTWSQATYRDWYLTTELDEPPRINVEIVLRLQRLAQWPERELILSVLPGESPSVGGESLARSAPTVETLYGTEPDEPPSYAFEVSYEGEYPLDEASLDDGSVLDERFGALGGWISKTLVGLGDLELSFHPPEEE